MTGIPCSYAISCLRHERISEDSVLPWCYSIEAFSKAYGWNILICNDKSAWKDIGGPEVKPPVYEKRVGRPRKARRKAAHEVGGPNGPRLTKHGTIIHCGHYREPGHNSATCARKKSGEPAVKKAKQPIPTPIQPDQSATVQVCAHPIKCQSKSLYQTYVPGFSGSEPTRE